MSPSVLIALTGAIGVFSLLTSAFAILIAWKKPQLPPDVTQLQADFITLRQAYVDIEDKLEAWMRRDSVRQARRARQEGAEAAQVLPTDPRARKNHLRALASGGG